jgi:hypothetical protein
MYGVAKNLALHRQSICRVENLPPSKKQGEEQVAQPDEADQGFAKSSMSDTTFGTPNSRLVTAWLAYDIQGGSCIITSGWQIKFLFLLQLMTQTASRPIYIG